MRDVEEQGGAACLQELGLDVAVRVVGDMDFSHVDLSSSPDSVFYQTTQRLPQHA